MNATRRVSQSEVFLAGEGNSYYERNKPALGADTDFYWEERICQELSPFKDEVQQILEIGCANGVKIEYLAKFFGADGWGIDPSAKAVEEGNERLARKAIGNVRLKAGTADKLPFEKQQFDLVYFAFCLYLVDRGDLFAAIAEADRVLRQGGFLVIVDFDPGQRYKRPYRHKEGIFSYKQPYADLFTASGHYYLVSKDSFSHAGRHFVKDEDERVSLCVLYKEENAYGVKPIPGAL